MSSTERAHAHEQARLELLGQPNRVREAQGSEQRDHQHPRPRDSDPPRISLRDVADQPVASGSPLHRAHRLGIEVDDDVGDDEREHARVYGACSA